MRILRPDHYLPTIGGLAKNLCAGSAVFPFYASFKLTSRCHFGCPFCNVKKNPVPDMSTDQVKSILDNLSRSPVLMVSFEGGEPLLRSDIGELLRYARSKAFYLLFTTSVKNIFDYPIQEYSKLIDFLHVSIDEGHDNLELFEILPRLTALPTTVAVQTVVTRQTVDSLEEKVRKCFEAKALIVIIPATHMDNAEDCSPDMGLLEQKLLALRKKYPGTIHTPPGYFSAYKNKKCSSASVIIAPDGLLYYPCHIRGTKGPDLSKVDLSRWLESSEAKKFREEMKSCDRNCGWYQYYSIDSYTSPWSVWEAVRPVLFNR